MGRHPQSGFLVKVTTMTDRQLRLRKKERMTACRDGCFAILSGIVAGCLLFAGMNGWLAEGRRLLVSLF